MYFLTSLSLYSQSILMISRYTSCKNTQLLFFLHSYLGSILLECLSVLKKIILMLLGSVEEWVPETRVLGTHSTMEKWVEGKLDKDFLHFLPYLMIFQISAAPSAHSTLKILQIW